MINNYFKYEKLLIENDVVFEANDSELKELKRELIHEKKNNIKVPKIIKKFIELGWSKNELLRIAPLETKKYFSRRSFLVIVDIIFIIIILLLNLFIKSNYQSEEILMNFVNLATVAFFVFFVFILFRLFPNKQKTIMDRRVIIFLDRIQKKFQINEFDDPEKIYLKIKENNSKKIFIPEKGSKGYLFKVFGGGGLINDKKFRVYVAKKYSHTVNDKKIYKYYIFYEFKIMPIPFHYSLVKEKYDNVQSQRLQNLNFNKGDFKDIDFAAREFNENWKLRGSDKKMAYQVFGPQMLALILKINTEDFIGMEISDSSVMMSLKFTKKKVERFADDINISYEIAKQVERNYRDVKWD